MQTYKDKELYFFWPLENKYGEKTKLVDNFILALSRSLLKKINQSGNHSFDEREDPEMPFWYNEQTTKGIITSSIDEITKTNFFQEYSIGRKSGSGRIDYWLEFSKGQNIQIVLEVKQSWLRVYYDHVTVFAHANYLFDAVREQIVNIKDKPIYCDFAIGLLVMPMYSRYKSKNDEIINLDKKMINILLDKIKTKITYNKIYEIVFLKTPGKFNKIHEFNNNHLESHPGICFIYYVNKITRDRVPS